MKKLILIFGSFLIICLIITYVAQEKVESKMESLETLSVSDDGEPIYLVKSENGRVVVYYGQELVRKTTTAVSTLPKIDQRELLYGITANSEEEVERILEEYCS
ncbi:MAG: hypothetical protein IJ275_06825 [Ruminococcus sp.]|nr:hypothetical protein [Ruminococcus sp.]